ncbi:MAG: beta-ketoacyl-ACP synthase II [Alphaproteobacteria bacterium]|nr:beta-ketoacyl-ACP synthase II [Alphaproteobacteria bacterium]
MRRVVVTGIGMISPLGCKTEKVWTDILSGKSGIKKISDDDLKDIPVKIAGLVDWGDDDNMFNPVRYMPFKEVKRHDRFLLYGIGAGSEALEDAGWNIEKVSEEEQERAGILMGSGFGGLQTVHEMALSFNESGMKKLSPFLIPASLINMIAGNLSIKYGLKGPNLACVTACSTGNHAIGEASRLIADGDADIMLAGGAEAVVNPLGLAGFAKMRAITAEFNDEPEKASRPWDKRRSGFVMSEGAAALVLEELEHAKARGAKIYAEIAGYGMSSDAYHITAPSGEGAFRAMKTAVNKAKLNGVELTDINYINAHGTSTPLGDISEISAVKKLFGDEIKNISMSSTKSATGHMLGAAGAIEAIFSILAIRDQICPPTINLEDIDDEAKGIDLVPLKAKKRKINAVMSNSFGFGGTNSCMIIKKYE